MKKDTINNKQIVPVTTKEVKIRAVDNGLIYGGEDEEKHVFELKKNATMQDAKDLILKKIIPLIVNDLYVICHYSDESLEKDTC